MLSWLDMQRCGPRAIEIDGDKGIAIIHIRGDRFSLRWLNQEFILQASLLLTFVLWKKMSVGQ